ncbi:MAG: DUF47 family protein [Desulfovibrio sp.]|jgi:uncharacterized protein Yka (UPF0111/DUF47 family)|nr:DUF47 family protein [Desulfovibrio sp.]
MFASLMPKSAPFFEMLDEQNAILRDMAGLLVEMLEAQHEKDLKQKTFNEIAVHEEEADMLNGRILRALTQTFITPIDREDILRISQAQEEAIDSIQNLSVRLNLFELNRIRFPAMQMCRILVSMLDMTRLMLEGLAARRDCHKTKAFRAMRAECDMLLSTGLGELMDENQQLTPVTVMQTIKWVQTYERLEMLLGRVNAMAETIEEAVLKNV